VPDRPLEVRVSGGIVRGARVDGAYAWRGIPYAAPPIGALRFRAPQDVVPWRGIRDATRFGDVAPQAHRGQFRGTAPDIPASEDCLTINVLAPATARAGRRLPVMVFIHGGGYSTGSSQDFSGQGTGFVSSGRVLYVSFNYRLGALGYLDFSHYATVARPIDGNLGLRDQVAALRWVRRNIRRFGGDRRNVTVFGESAGGNAVVTLLATPAAHGLFARAIAQSAPADAVYPRERAAGWAGEFVEILATQKARARSAERNAVRDSAVATPIDTARARPPLARSLVNRPGVARPVVTARVDASPVVVQPPVARPPVGQSPIAMDVVALLDGASSAELVTAALSLQIRTPEITPGYFCLAPVVDGIFLPRRPLDAIAGGRAHRVPLIIGTNDREGSIFRGRVDILPRSPARVRAVFQNAPSDSRAAMRRAYQGLTGPRVRADFGGDYAFWYPSLRAAELHARFARVYAYRFDFAPRMMRVAGLDATHGIELFALFDSTNEPVARAMTVLGGRTAFADVGARMRKRWLDFACTGVLGPDWPAYADATRTTLIIDVADRQEHDPHRERRLAWAAFRPDV
jgi:Carboxylesterase type B